MNELEKQTNENTTELGKVGSQNMEAKTEYKKLKATKKPAKHPMADAVASVFNRCNGDTNCIAATLMIPKHVIEDILKNENI